MILSDAPGTPLFLPGAGSAMARNQRRDLSESLDVRSARRDKFPSDGRSNTLWASGLAGRSYLLEPYSLPASSELLCPLMADFVAKVVFHC